MYNLACLRDSNVCVADLETYNLGNVLRKTVLQGCPLIDIVFCSLENSEMERLQLTDPSLHVCTGKLQNWQNHLRDRKKYLCIKFCYTKPVMIFFYKHSENIPRRAWIHVPPIPRKQACVSFLPKKTLNISFLQWNCPTLLRSDEIFSLCFLFNLNEARVVVGSVCALDSGALDRPRGRRPDPTADSQRLKQSKIVCHTKKDHCRAQKKNSARYLWTWHNAKLFKLTQVI